LGDATDRAVADILPVNSTAAEASTIEITVGADYPDARAWPPARHGEDCWFAPAEPEPSARSQQTQQRTTPAANTGNHMRSLVSMRRTIHSPRS
jgi:hypothetical protein